MRRMSETSLREPSSPTTDPAGRSAARIAAGERIGRYLVLDTLGEGGMAIVYAAYDIELDRKVAIKVLRADAYGDQHSVGLARLQREAQSMARLNHPNIAQVYDVGPLRKGVFIAMELVQGDNLRTWLTRQPRTWRAVVDVFLQAGEGLAAAHAAGIIHREHKPTPLTSAPNTGAPPISSDPAELRGRGLPRIAPRRPEFSRSRGKTVAMATGSAASAMRPRAHPRRPGRVTRPSSGRVPRIRLAVRPRTRPRCRRGRVSRDGVLDPRWDTQTDPSGTAKRIRLEGRTAEGSAVGPLPFATVLLPTQPAEGARPPTSASVRRGLRAVASWPNIDYEGQYYARVSHGDLGSCSHGLCTGKGRARQFRH